MDGTVLLQGRFTSTGQNTNIAIPSNVDWMYVYNQNAITQAAANLGAVFYWQRGMAAGRGISTVKQAAIANAPLTIGFLASPGGFTLLNEGDGPDATPLIGPAVPFTAISNANNPVVSTVNTAGLSIGSVVRLSMTNLQFTSNPSDLLGVDLEIDTIVTNTSFRLSGTLANVPGAVAGAGNYRVVNTDSIFYPQTRYIVNITQAPFAVVTTSVDHGYVAGQIVRFHVTNTVNGMVEIDQLEGTITATTIFTFTVNIDTTAMTPFTFPTVSQVIALQNAYTPAFVGPVGEDTAFALSNNLNTLADASFNTAIIGMTLAAGAFSPAGQFGDIIYWVAGKSYAVFNS